MEFVNEYAPCHVNLRLCAGLLVLPRTMEEEDFLCIQQTKNICHMDTVSCMLFLSK